MIPVLNEFREFVKAAYRDPVNVSTIFPSLRYLSQAMIRQAAITSDSHVLELGCGSGAITKHILSSETEFASYTGVEIDEGLVSFLHQKYPDARILNASADDLSAHIEDNSIDTIVCSLPWTLFPRGLQESIMNEILRVLKPGGRFTTFLCIHALTYPGAPRIKDIFRESFSTFERKQTVALNIPPANVYGGQKQLD